MVANAAFVRPPGAVVLHPVSPEDLDAPVVHPDRHGHLELSPRPPEQLALTVVEPQAVGCTIEEDVDGFICARAIEKGHRK